MVHTSAGVVFCLTLQGECLREDIPGLREIEPRRHGAVAIKYVKHDLEFCVLVLKYRMSETRMQMSS